MTTCRNLCSHTCSFGPQSALDLEERPFGFGVEFPSVIWLNERQMKKELLCHSGFTLPAS